MGLPPLAPHAPQWPAMRGRRQPTDRGLSTVIGGGGVFVRCFYIWVVGTYYMSVTDDVSKYKIWLKDSAPYNINLEMWGA